MVNLITVMVLVWRLYGKCVESDTFNEDFMVKLAWRLSGVLWRKRGRSNYQATPISVI